jgi:hypothetical protein
MPIVHSAVARGRKGAPRFAIDAEIIAAAFLLSAVLAVGLLTAADYGLTVDEFNTDDYGPKALAWYTSGFKDRSHFETVEFSLWYYGPWFHIDRRNGSHGRPCFRPPTSSSAGARSGTRPRKDDSNIAIVDVRCCAIARR